MAFDYVNAIIRLGPCGSAERWLNENRGATAQQLWDKCPDWCWMTWLCDIVAWRIRSESFGATDPKRATSAPFSSTRKATAPSSWLRSWPRSIPTTIALLRS